MRPVLGQDSPQALGLDQLRVGDVMDHLAGRPLLPGVLVEVRHRQRCDGLAHGAGASAVQRQQAKPFLVLQG